MPAIEFRNVYFRYNDTSPWVLNNFSLTIDTNQTVAIIGHNGSGKSTIAKLANGLLTPQAGEILIHDRKISSENLWEIRGNVGMVFQNPENQFVGTTVRDDVAFGLENRAVPREEMLKRVQASLKDVQMEQYEDHEPHHLSGGQKQRVAIASVMAAYPEILLLDEATSMLDPRGRKEILSTIYSLKKKHKMSLVMITHDMNEIALADQIIVMNKGSIFIQSDIETLFTHHQALEEIGLTLPYTVKLALELENHTYNFPKYPLRNEEFIEALWTLNLNK